MVTKRERARLLAKKKKLTKKSVVSESVDLKKKKALLKEQVELKREIKKLEASLVEEQIDANTEHGLLELNPDEKTGLLITVGDYEKDDKFTQNFNSYDRLETLINYLSTIKEELYGEVSENMASEVPSDYLTEEVGEGDLTIEVDLVPYDVKKKSDYEYTFPNLWGMDGLRKLKMPNYGEYYNLFGVDVSEDEIDITLFDEIVEDNAGDFEDALISAISIIDDEYSSIDWELLSNPTD